MTFGCIQTYIVLLIRSLDVYNIASESECRPASARKSENNMRDIRALFISLSLLLLGCDAWSVDGVAKVNATDRV